MNHALCPAQQQGLDELRQLLPLGSVFTLSGPGGSGRTTVLRLLHQQSGGAFLNMKDFTDMLRERNPVALEETFERMVLDAMKQHRQIIVDDLGLLSNVVGSCNHFYQRRGLLDSPLTTIATLAVESDQKLIFGYGGCPSEPIAQRCHLARIREFDAGDYSAICHNYLGEQATQIDFAKLFRFARELNAHQLKAACQWLAHHHKTITTELFIEYLRTMRLSSNVDLGEVQPVNLHDLKGVEEVIRSLEVNIIVPLENDELASELNLKPKRGVLLAGPPGTGKTTVGRALAHRLKSKFFLLDGTFIAGTRDFYEKVHYLFEKAKQNAPSILFIDDSDVLFENREEHGPGLYRYLLTLLDGLESEKAGRVCVMMTVMDVGGLPPALVRSGRVELWLDMRLPNEDARSAILSQHVANLPAPLVGMNVAQLAAATDGFSGADLKRLAEDGKALFAYDKARGQTPKAATDYFLAAVETVRANKERYAEAEARAARHSGRHVNA
jgi:ATP-dependent 26S proteasome regulatory subunit